MLQKIAARIDPRITVGNLVTAVVFLVAWGVSGAVWYTQVQGHIKDFEVHRSTSEEQKMIDDRIKLLTDAQIADIRRRLDNIEAKQEESLRVLYQIKGRVDKDR